MELLNQDAKALMEACKIKARGSGLSFDNETLEYIVTNQDLLRLTPKIMIPTLYDYWEDGLTENQEKLRYKFYPHNPYETVINTRPAVSFYNDNNPDWLNVMIFYHVLGHIDFFQNNIFFRNTWDDDFMATARADKMLIDRIRRDLGEKKRYVDYVIEFTRSLDNLVGYYKEMNHENQKKIMTKTEFFFGPFLRERTNAQKWQKLSDEYDEKIETLGNKKGKEMFFYEMRIEFPEFREVYKKYLQKDSHEMKDDDVISFIMNHSQFLQKKENNWMKEVMEIVRRTSLYFQAQIRTKIMNEGWASYWHQELFLRDPMIMGNEVNYSRVNAGVMSMPKVGLNPYALGYMLIEFIEKLADQGKLSVEFERTLNREERKKFDKKTGIGKDFIFHIRKNFNDFMLLNFLSKENFQDFIDENKLFLADKVFSEQRRSWVYFIKSRKGEDYRNMVINSLYHPPHITFQKKDNGSLHIEHIFEGKQLKTNYIPGVLRGAEFLWGDAVTLTTTEFQIDQNSVTNHTYYPEQPIKHQKIRVKYRMKDGKIAKKND